MSRRHILLGPGCGEVSRICNSDGMTWLNSDPNKGVSGPRVVPKLLCLNSLMIFKWSVVRLVALGLWILWARFGVAPLVHYLQDKFCYDLLFFFVFLNRQCNTTNSLLSIIISPTAILLIVSWQRSSTTFCVRSTMPTIFDKMTRLPTMITFVLDLSSILLLPCRWNPCLIIRIIKGSVFSAPEEGHCLMSSGTDKET